MRLFPILAAVVAVALLYFLVFERDRLLTFSGVGTEAESVAMSGEVEPVDTTAEEGTRAVPVVVLRSEATIIDGAVILRGLTEAARQVDLRAETSGLIISTPLRKGAFIEEGDIVCQLDPGTREIALMDANARLLEAAARHPEAKARLAEAKARLVEAQINDRAALRLSKDGFASDTRVAQTAAAGEAARAGVEAANSGVESARAGVQSAEAGVAAAKSELGKLEIIAPFAGLLETDSAELGSLQQPGSLCATIIQLDPIKLVGFIPEKMVDLVEVGVSADARLSSGREVTGTVTFLSRSADPTTRTFRVDVEVANTDLSIRDGQTAEITIHADGTTAHLLPQSALTLNDDGELGVRIVLENAAAFAPVRVLRDTTEGNWVEGLPAQVDVIVVGQEFVTDGVPVTVTYREATQ